MAKITISLEKSVHENAGIYFDKAKKAKKKIDGAMQALEKTKKKLSKLEKKKPEDVDSGMTMKNKKREWFEKFRWFYTSEGFLVIGGRDATTNEIVIKKHTEKNDIVFHTDMAGSPFFVIKSAGNEITENAKEEAAIATAAFSRAWKAGLSTSEVFYVNPDQVTKEAQAGEYLPKGAFMVRGKTTYLKPQIRLAIGIKDQKIVSGPIAAIDAHCDHYLIIEQGEKKPSDAAKDIKKHLKYPDTDEIIRALPAGGCRIKEDVKKKKE